MSRSSTETTRMNSRKLGPKPLMAIARDTKSKSAEAAAQSSKIGYLSAMELFADFESKRKNK